MDEILYERCKRVLNLNANEIEEKVIFAYLFSIIRKWLWPVIKKISHSALQYLKIPSILTTGVPRFTLLMWGHTKKMWKQKLRKLRLLSSTKGEENRIES